MGVTGGLPLTHGGSLAAVVGEGDVVEDAVGVSEVANNILLGLLGACGPGLHDAGEHLVRVPVCIVVVARQEETLLHGERVAVAGDVRVGVVIRVRVRGERVADPLSDDCGEAVSEGGEIVSHGCLLSFGGSSYELSLSDVFRPRNSFSERFSGRDDDSPRANLGLSFSVAVVLGWKT